MAVIAVTKVQYETMPGENCAKWTIEVQRWDNVCDRPVNRLPKSGDIPESVRKAIEEWLNERDWDSYY